MPDGILPRLQRAFARRRAAAPRRRPRAAIGAAAAPAVAGAAPRAARRRGAAARARPGQVVPRRAGAGRRRRRGAARRDPRPARAERLGQVDLHQRRQRPLPAQRRRASSSKGASSPAGRRTASRAPASRAPTRSRGPFAPPERARQRGAGGDVRRRRAPRRAAARREAMTWLAFTGLQDKAHALPDDAEPAPAQVPRTRARAGLAAAPGAARRGAVRPDAERDRRRGGADPAHPRPGLDGRLRRARDARGDGADRPRRRLRPRRSCWPKARPPR